MKYFPFHRFRVVVKLVTDGPNTISSRDEEEEHGDGSPVQHLHKWVLSDGKSLPQPQKTPTGSIPSVLLSFRCSVC